MALSSQITGSQTRPQDVYTDLNSLQGIRQLGKQDKSAALMEVARQFESMFMNMMLTSMRQANAVFTEDSMFNSPEMDFYQGMYDNQMALQLSGDSAAGSFNKASNDGASSTVANSKGVGLADVIYRQLMSTYNGSGEVPELDQSKLFERRIAGSNLQQAIEKVDDVLQQQGQSASVNSVAQSTTAAAVQAAASTGTAVGKTAANSTDEATAVASGSGSKGQQFASPEEFVAALYPHAKAVAAELGVDARAIVAQAALETGWGQHMITDEQGRNSFNFFGIKADSRWQGDSVSVMTHEYHQGVRVNESAEFRSYASLEQGLRDYADFLSNSERYQQAIGQGLAADQYGHALQQAGYATDPDYGSKIERIARSAVVNDWAKDDQPTTEASKAAAGVTNKQGVQ
ncbi:glucosaminidase domain-containing protein [Oceanobacter mangrovi]|uniref:glucosaminidase domain-containing protein n=1 Tax=Oceanobacter mangrovi TaxID=2862510 RepID=UPI001C8D81E9|nr:glucosaminidase domain-containing protein [Oceanobacter mangrovi]